MAKTVAIVMFGSTITGGGGAERRFGRAFSLLRNRGESVYLITNQSLYASLVAAGIVSSSDRVVIYPGPFGRGILDSMKISAWLTGVSRDHGFDVMHLVLVQRTLIPFYVYLYLDRRFHVVSTVAYAKLGATDDIPLSFRLINKIIWNRSNVIDSLYARFTEKYSAEYGTKLSTTPCSFTDYSRFYPETPKEPWVVFSGRLIPDKRPLEFLSSIIELRNAVGGLGEWRFFVLGGGPLEGEVRKTIAAHNLEHLVTCTALPDVSPVIRKSSVFVSMQEHENYPSQSLIEAMASGNCVIATDVGETRRLVNESRGVLIDNAAPGTLAEALRCIMFDPLLRANLGTAAAQYVRQHHTIDRFAEYLCGIWERASD